MKKNGSGPLSRRIGLLVTLLAATFFIRMTGNMIQTTIPLFGTHYLAMNAAEVGIASTVFMLPAILTPILIVSRVRMEKVSAVLLVSAIIFTACVPLFAFVGSVPEFYILMILASISSYTIMPLLLTSSQTVSAGYEHRDIAVYTVALSTSLVFGPLFEGVVAGHYQSLRVVFLAFAPFVFGAAALLGWRHFRSIAATEERQAEEPRAEAASGPRYGDVGRLLRLTEFRAPIIAQLCYSIVFASILSFGGILAEDNIHAGLSEVYYLFTTFFVTSLIARIMLTAFPDPSGKIRLLHLSLLLSITGLLVMVFSRNVAVMYLTFAILGIPHGLQYPVSSMIIAEKIPRKDLPTANALFTSTSAIGMALTPVALGYTSLAVGLTYSFVLLTVPVVLLWSQLYMVSRSLRKSSARTGQA